MSLRNLIAAGIVSAAAIVATAATAAEVTEKGAELGKWTSDAPAAQELSKKTGKPLFIQFTGSDWCGWCKLMDGKVFSTTEWADYAKDNLVLLYIDFPRGKQQSQELKAQNAKLSEQYGVGGFPTYIILDAQGKQIGQLGASQDATAPDFIDQVKDVLIVQDLEKLLSAEDLAAYKAAEAELADLEKKVEAWQAKMMQEAQAMQTLFDAANAKLDALKAKAREAAKTK